MEGDLYEAETVWEFGMADQVKFGIGASRELPSTIHEYGASSVLFVSDSGVKDAGIIDHLRGVLNNHNIEIAVHTDVESEPSIEAYNEAIRAAKSFEPEVIVGVGGGSSMDVAKTTSALLNDDSPICEYASPPLGNNRSIPTTGCPSVCVPTTSGTGSEVSPVAVLSATEENYKSGLSDRQLRPDMALVDPTLVTSLPPAPTAFSGMDALGHAIESYSAIRFDAKPRPSNPEDRPDYNGRSVLTDQLAKKAIELVGNNLRCAVDNGNDLSARRSMALASLLAGMAFTNSGTTAAHALAMATGAEFDIPHGVAVAIFLPEVIRYNTQSAPERFDEIVRLLGGEKTASNASEAVADLRRDVGIVSSLNEYGVTEEHVGQLADKTLDMERLLSQNARRITQTDIEHILRSAL